MRLNEIDNKDDSFWKMTSRNNNSFYVDYEDLKKRYMILSSSHDKSTTQSIVANNIKDLDNMKKEISNMYKFCKNSSQDTETEEFMKQLKLMYNGCKDMIRDLERFL